MWIDDMPFGRVFYDGDRHAWSVEEILTPAAPGDPYGLVMVRHTTDKVCRTDRQVIAAGHGECGGWYVAPDRIVRCGGQLRHPAGGPAECGEPLFALVAVTGQDRDQPPPGTSVPAWPPAPPRWPPFTAAPGDGQAGEVAATPEAA